jgi:hypothetical protein
MILNLRFMRHAEFKRTNNFVIAFSKFNKLAEYFAISLLYYMGWITIKGYDEGLYIFEIPNRVIQESIHKLKMPNA